MAISVVWLLLLVFGGRDAVGEGDGEGVQRWLPACDPSCLTGALGVQASGDQVEGLHGGLLVGEVATGPYRPAEPRVEAFDGVGGAQHASYLDVVGEEGGELLPCAQPQGLDRRVGAAPLVEELVAGPDRVAEGGRGVDGLEVAADLVPVLPRGVAEGVSDQVDVMPTSA